MMVKNKIFTWLLLVVSITTSTTINAQDIMNTGQMLSAQQQSIIGIAAVTAKGDLPKLKVELNKGLDAGLTVNEIKEAIIHLYAYAGFPRSIRGLQTFMTILDNRRKNGIVDEIGPEASPIRDQRSRYDRGKANLDSLLGTPQTGPPKG